MAPQSTPFNPYIYVSICIYIYMYMYIHTYKPESADGLRAVHGAAVDTLEPNVAHAKSPLAHTVTAAIPGT